MVVNQMFSRKGRNPHVVTSIELQDLAAWLVKLTRPIDCGTTTESSIEFVMIRSELRFNRHDQFNRHNQTEGDEVFGCLRDWLKTIELNIWQVIVDSDTLNFNIHQTYDDSGGLEISHTLRLFSIADNEFGLFWTWDTYAQSTRGLLWCLNESGRRQAYTILNSLLQLGVIYNSSLLPALSALQVATSEMRLWITNEGIAITTLQIETGHHAYATIHDHAGDKPSDPQDPQDMDLATMTKTICGMAVNITTSALYMQRIVQLADLILEEAANINQGQEADPKDMLGKQTSYESNHVIVQRTKSAKRQAQGLLAEAEAWKHKATIVVQTLLSLTTQRDQAISIGIAEDSRTLAHKATRDSTSMKAIAAVTVFFLPGTFVSSLFAMPMFDWDVSSGTSLNRHFWIYWVVTLPLTAVVIITWLAWTNKESIGGVMKMKSKPLEIKKEV